MRHPAPAFPVLMFLLFAFGSARFAAQSTSSPRPGEPTDPKARKTWADALDWQRQRRYASAIDEYRKANRQDGNRCARCLEIAYSLALQIGAYKDAESIAHDMLTSEGPISIDPAAAHYRIAIALQRQGIESKKDKCFLESCDEFKAALQASPALTLAHYTMGISLAHLHQDDDARQEFSTFLDKDKGHSAMRGRAERYIENINLARAPMAPPFSFVALDGRQISLDDLTGKVVLIDFWATWCGPCREALPHIRSIAQRFQGQPLVVLSISLDKDEAKWKDFVAKNGMTWLQYRDGGFDGRVARQFGVTAIPATFTIDADGILEDQHVGDASIDGKLKKLVTRANELAKSKPAPPADNDSATTN